MGRKSQKTVRRWGKSKEVPDYFALTRGTYWDANTGLLNAPHHNITNKDDVLENGAEAEWENATEDNNDWSTGTPDTTDDAGNFLDVRGDPIQPNGWGSFPGDQDLERYPPTNAVWNNKGRKKEFLPGDPAMMNDEQYQEYLAAGGEPWFDDDTEDADTDTKNQYYGESTEDFPDEASTTSRKSVGKRKAGDPTNPDDEDYSVFLREDEDAADPPGYTDVSGPMRQTPWGTMSTIDYSGRDMNDPDMVGEGWDEDDMVLPGGQLTSVNNRDESEDDFEGLDTFKGRKSVRRNRKVSRGLPQLTQEQLDFYSDPGKNAQMARDQADEDYAGDPDYEAMQDLTYGGGGTDSDELNDSMGGSLYRPPGQDWTGSPNLPRFSPNPPRSSYGRKGIEWDEDQNHWTSGDDEDDIDPSDADNEFEFGGSEEEDNRPDSDLLLAPLGDGFYGWPKGRKGRRPVRMGLQDDQDGNIEDDVIDTIGWTDAKPGKEKDPRDMTDEEYEIYRSTWDPNDLPQPGGQNGSYIFAPKGRGVRQGRRPSTKTAWALTQSGNNMQMKQAMLLLQRENAELKTIATKAVEKLETLGRLPANRVGRINQSEK